MGPVRIELTTLGL